MKGWGMILTLLSLLLSLSGHWQKKVVTGIWATCKGGYNLGSLRDSWQKISKKNPQCCDLQYFNL
ncbi:hypothetical protein GLYMA_04G076366v4 [Glycine max]|nr:hypothetical protein GLYMA_04G076366v4 [Glycine max]KAH1110306.1 hypothetical protein GYH30_009254 [Glycine max]